MRNIFLILPMLSIGCTANMENAPFGSQITMPEELTLAWNAAANVFDLSGMLFFFDVGVLDEDGLPLPNVRVEITTSFNGVYLLPQEAIEVVSYPGLPSGVNSIEDVKEACTDDNGNYVLAEDWCAWYWDTETQQFYQFAGSYANSYESSDTGGYYWFAPTHVVTETNNRGLVRIYSMIDVMPVTDESGTEFSPVQITATTGWAFDSFMINPSTGASE
jgi:hypothetical protein